MRINCVRSTEYCDSSLDDVNEAKLCSLLPLTIMLFGLRLLTAVTMQSYVWKSMDDDGSAAQQRVITIGED